MAFTYTDGLNPAIDYPRFLASDTVEFGPSGERVYAFSDEEIRMATRIEMGVFQSAQFFSGPMGATLPNTPIPWRRIAANLLDALASSQARMAIITKLLDVNLNPKAPYEMRETAKALRQVEDDSGAFFVCEQVSDVFSFRDRYFATIQRQSGGSPVPA